MRHRVSEFGEQGVVRDRVIGPLDRAGIEKKLAEILKP
jgi:hypothetical protein